MYEHYRYQVKFLAKMRFSFWSGFYRGGSDIKAIALIKAWNFLHDPKNKEWEHVMVYDSKKNEAVYLTRKPPV